MWYTGDDGASSSRIGLATSTNGVNWTKHATNPVLSPSQAWETAGIQAGSVISDGGLYKMWYTGLDNNGVSRIGYATSSNGITWTKYEGNPVLGIGGYGSWDSEDVSRPAVIKEGGTYRMWYTGDDGVTSRIGYATSNDGISWGRDPANPVVDVGQPGAWDWLQVYGPSVVVVGTEYRLWYSGGTLPDAWQTGYAVSSDGSNWTRQAMLIAEGAPGAFDAYSADYPSVIADGGQFKLWYSGLNEGGTYNIGYFTVQLCNVVPTAVVYLPAVMRIQDPCRAYYTDNFSDPDSGWQVDDDSNRRYAYTGGEYQIQVKRPSDGWFVTPGAKATGFTGIVSARRAAGSSGWYGIIFGLSGDWNQFYEFTIGPNDYSIWKYDHGNWTALQSQTVSSHIRSGTQWNRLKVVRDGYSITVYVNNQHLVTLEDGSFTGLRRIGLVAYSPSSGPLDARFDDFSLYPPGCGASVTGVRFDATFEMDRPESHVGPMPPGLERSP